MLVATGTVRHAGTHTQRPGGFTLIEVMVVVAMLAIVSSLVAPSFRAFIGTMNSKSVAFDLINDLTAARSEAIRRNANTTLVPVAGDWAKGWQLRDANGATLRERAAMSSSLSLTAPAAGVTFRPNGRLSDDTSPANLRWSVSSTIAGVTARCVVISPTGAARSSSGVCS
jgi:type IV fimbrial biogenesis protein FimT